MLSQDEMERLTSAISGVGGEGGVRTRGGVYAIRNLLRLSPEVRELAWTDQVRSMAGATLGSGAWPVRAILFDKTPGANWLVPWHQDLTICVRAKLDLPGYGPWTRKAGVWHVQPPVAVLEGMLSVRLHLDHCGASNGALRVLPGTHKLGRLSGWQIAEQQRLVTAVRCDADAGDALLMRPLLVHASSPAAEAGHRRVVHIDYACSRLEGGLEWAVEAD